MKALIIIASCILFAVALRFIEVLTSRKTMKSVGAKSNRNSWNIAKVDISNPEELRKFLDLYKDLAD